MARCARAEVRVRACACVAMCVRACVTMCVRACARACVRVRRVIRNELRASALRLGSRGRGQAASPCREEAASAGHQRRARVFRVCVESAEVQRCVRRSRTPAHGGVPGRGDRRCLPDTRRMRRGCSPWTARSRRRRRGVRHGERAGGVSPMQVDGRHCLGAELPNLHPRMRCALCVARCALRAARCALRVACAVCCVLCAVLVGSD